MGRRKSPARDEQQREDLGSAVVRKSLPDEYRVEVSDALNSLALRLHKAFSEMHPLELVKLDDHFRKSIKLTDPPKAKQVIETLTLIGMGYTEAIGESAKRHAEDVAAARQESAA